MKIDILTLFPEAFDSALNFSILKRAREKGKIEIGALNIRDFTGDKHRTTDDVPYGGNEGMVMKVEPIVKALRHVGCGMRDESGKTRIVLLSASGKRLTQAKLEEYSKLDRLVLICGRYEGVDERVLNFIDEEICVGDYVLSGGEIGAMAIVEGTARLIPGVLGNEESAKNESFVNGILDFPHYTRPREYMGLQVPEILTSGNHAKVALWRKKQAFKKTLANRPELLENLKLSKEDKKILDGILKGEKDEQD